MKWLLGLTLALAAPLAAETLPQPGPGDPHIQYVEFNSDQVVVLNGTMGFAMTLELSPDERVENVALGNGNAWQVQVNRRSDKLFIKPLVDGVATNMTVITDTRRYSFTLRSGEPIGQPSPYTVRFTYPGLAVAKQPETTEKLAGYKLSGKKALWPTAMSDDGRFTAIVWPADSTMPAVYKVDARRQETLVNGVVRDGAYVVEGFAPSFVFRLGADMARAKRVPVKDLR